jgi:prophage DNA circulation protein
MTWTDQYLDASFRGVPFNVPRHRRQLGRRLDVHQYALRETPWPEDLGREARRFSITAVILGADYFADRDRLIAAIEDVPGPGQLVHPYLGTKTVTCLGGSVEESQDRGGMATFDLEFVEAGENAAPAASSDTPAVAVAAAEEADAGAQAAMGEGFDVSGMPAFVLTGAIGDVQGGLDAIGKAADRLSGISEGLYAYTRQAQAIAGQVSGLAREPLMLAARISGLVVAVRGLATSPLAALSALRPLISHGLGLAALGVTPARRRQDANRQALNLMVSTAAASQAVIAASQATFDSYADAATVRDGLAEDLDGLGLRLADAGDDANYELVRAMRLAMVADVTARGGNLRRLRAYVPPATAPALVIAQRLYGDATLADDIIARNRIRNPNFVPGGQALEVLTDG